MSPEEPFEPEDVEFMEEGLSAVQKVGLTLLVIFAAAAVVAGVLVAVAR